MNRTTKLSIALTAALFLSLAQAPAFAQEAARLAPAEADVFVQVDDLSGWRAQWKQDPLAEFLRDQGVERRKRHHEAWLDMARAMDLTPGALFDAFFGTRIVLIGDAAEDGSFVLITTMRRGIITDAVTSLGLKEDGQIGEHRLYLTPDGQTQVAIHGRQVAMAHKGHLPWLRQVLTLDEEDARLADDEAFRQWMQRLPAGPHAAVAFARDGEDEVHAFACRRIGRGLDLHYAGTSEKFDEMLAQVGGAGALDFGPLPASTIGATMVNLFDPDPQGAQRLDGLVAPASFKDDVLAGLEAPTVFFLGEIEGGVLRPQTNFNVPVVGMAIKLKDEATAEHIDTMLGRAFTLVRMGMAAQGLPPFEASEGSRDGIDYHVLDFGEAVVKKTEREDLRGTLRLTMGRIGDWYLIASHEDFFRQAIAAHGQPGLSLGAQKALLPVEDKTRPILTSVFRAPFLADHLQTWLTWWEQERPVSFEAAQDERPTDPEAKLIRCVRIAAGALDHYDTLGAQVWTVEGEEVDIVHARIQVQRR